MTKKGLKKKLSTGISTKKKFVEMGFDEKKIFEAGYKRPNTRIIVKSTFIMVVLLYKNIKCTVSKRETIFCNVTDFFKGGKHSI